MFDLRSSAVELGGEGPIMNHALELGICNLVLNLFVFLFWS